MSDLLQIGSNALVAAGQSLDRTAEQIARLTATPSYPGPLTNTNDYLNDQPGYSNEPVYSPSPFGGAAVFAQDTSFSQSFGIGDSGNQDLGIGTDNSGVFGDPLIAQSFAMIAATNQYQAAASLVSTGHDLSATLLQTTA